MTGFKYKHNEVIDVFLEPLIKRHEEEYYECHRVKFPVKPKILDFIRLGRVFVYG
jgi:hypothetical protein